MKLKLNRKGIAVIDDLIALTIAAGVIMAIIVIPWFVLKIHIVNVIQFEDKYNTADLAMLALLSTKNDGKETLQILAEHITLNNPSDISFVNATLDKIVRSKCYEIATGISKGSAPAYALMIKPYSFSECSPDMSTKTKSFCRIIRKILPKFWSCQYHERNRSVDCISYCWRNITV